MSENQLGNCLMWLTIGLLVIIGLFVADIGLLYGLSSNSINNSKFKLFSIDKSQCITVITNSDSRYFIIGEKESIPKDDYLKVDISEIDQLGDEIGVCWRSDSEGWEVVNDGAVIIENKLDTLKFKFQTSWERDQRGIPNATKYHQVMCGTIGIETMSVYNNEYLLVEE